jgi:hypothetical protein
MTRILKTPTTISECRFFHVKTALQAHLYIRCTGFVQVKKLVNQSSMLTFAQFYYELNLLFGLIFLV